MFILCLTLETSVLSTSKGIISRSWFFKVPKKSSENFGLDGFQKATFSVENIFKKPPMIPNLHGSFSVI